MRRIGYVDTLGVHGNNKQGLNIFISVRIVGKRGKRGGVFYRWLVEIGVFMEK